MVGKGRKFQILLNLPVSNVLRCIGSNAKTTTRGADKSLARPGRKQAAPVKSVMVRGMDWFGWGRDRWWTVVSVVMNLQVQ